MSDADRVLEKAQNAVDIQVLDDIKTQQWERIWRTEAALDDARKAIEWVLKDAAYKAPEQIDSQMVQRWLHRLRLSIDSQASDKGERG